MRKTIIRGEVCIGTATFLSFATLILLIFAHVAQLNTSTIPRGISMVKVNVSQYGDALLRSFSDPTDGLYANDSNAPLAKDLGLRQLYAWGFYSYCGYVQPGQGICSNTSFGHTFQPFDTLVADVPPLFQTVTRFVVPDSSFKASSFLASLSRAGLYLAFISTILIALSMVFGLKRSNFSFFLSSTLAILASMMLLTSASIWTSLVFKARVINDAVVNTTTSTNSTNSVPLGIVVSFGPGVWLLWTAFATALLSTIPYVASCFTYRG